jgi:hypothetical protein
MIRLQGFPVGSTKEPWIRSELVKLPELKSVLPAGTRWVTTSDRATQIEKRKAQYEARLADH